MVTGSGFGRSRLPQTLGSGQRKRGPGLPLGYRQELTASPGLSLLGQLECEAVAKAAREMERLKALPGGSEHGRQPGASDSGENGPPMAALQRSYRRFGQE